jgi:hypothetical protein
MAVKHDEVARIRSSAWRNPGTMEFDAEQTGESVMMAKIRGVRPITSLMPTLVASPPIDRCVKFRSYEAKPIPS